MGASIILKQVEQYEPDLILAVGLSEHLQTVASELCHLCKYLVEKDVVPSCLFPFFQDEDFVYQLGYIHDIGKLWVPPSLFSKHGRLTHREKIIMQKHTVRGYTMLKLKFKLTPRKVSYKDSLILYSVLHHHERWDGLGYPNNLAGLRIPYVARVVGIADAIVAMFESRSYKESYTEDEVKRELKANRGGQFDPCLVDTILEGYFERRQGSSKARS